MGPEKVDNMATDNAKDLYKRLQFEIVKLFKKLEKLRMTKPFKQRKDILL